MRRPQKKWTEQEVAYLRKKYNRLGLNRVSEHLGITPHVCACKARKLGIVKKKQRIFTSENQAILEEHYGKKTLLEIANMIGVSERAVVARVYYMRLKNPGWKKELSRIKNSYPSWIKNMELRNQNPTF